jgi:hypothetical protein
MYLLVSTKYGLGYILCDLFTNASGHPDWEEGFVHRWKVRKRVQCNVIICPGEWLSGSTSAGVTGGHRLESRQGVRFIRTYSYFAVCFL